MGITGSRLRGTIRLTIHLTFVLFLSYHGSIIASEEGEMKSVEKEPCLAPLPSLPVLLQIARWYIHQAPQTDPKFMMYKKRAEKAIDSALCMLSYPEDYGDYHGDPCLGPPIRYQIREFVKTPLPCKVIPKF